MDVHVFTLHPAMFSGPLSESILKRAQQAGALRIHLHDIRDFTEDKHRTADEPPYGGGGGMIMKVEPVVRCVQAALPNRQGIPVLLTTPQGRVFNQAAAEALAAQPTIGIICGHYEGIDERVSLYLGADEVSIGDYVLTGGELAAMIIIDAAARLLPGVLGDPDAPAKDSHSTGLLEHPHYTRPPVFEGLAVPQMLLSGHEAQISRWRRQEALRRTWQRRPDLLLSAPLNAEDREFLLRLAEEAVQQTDH